MRKTEQSPEQVQEEFGIRYLSFLESKLILPTMRGFAVRAFPLIFEFMRYHYKKPTIYLSLYGELYICDHPLYDSCTLYTIGNKGLAVIQQRFDLNAKSTWWSEVDPWVTDSIYLNPNFQEYFYEHADICKDGLFPTVTVRQIMWALKMKPLPKEKWETVFDRKNI